MLEYLILRHYEACDYSYDCCYSTKSFRPEQNCKPQTEHSREHEAGNFHVRQFTAHKIFHRNARVEEEQVLSHQRLGH